MEHYYFAWRLLALLVAVFIENVKEPKIVNLLVFNMMRIILVDGSLG
jgi:hypothetical protein